MTDNPLSKIDTLPPLPYVAHEILLTINNADKDLADVAQTLGKEPGLTARIISMANSAFFANQRPVYSPEDAVVRLGMDRVRILSASVLLAQQFDASRCERFHPEEYWYQAVGTAFSAARLARYVDMPSGPDAAYLGGLLHNIGLLLLCYVFPSEMNEAFARYDEDREQSLSALCRQEVGSDHHEAGRLLLTAWSLPPEIIAVAAHCHEPAYRGDHAKLTQLIRFCRRWTMNGYGETPPLDALPEVPTARLEQLAKACQREQEQLEAFSRLLAAG